MRTEDIGFFSICLAPTYVATKTVIKVMTSITIIEEKEIYKIGVKEGRIWHTRSLKGSSRIARNSIVIATALMTPTINPSMAALPKLVIDS